MAGAPALVLALVLVLGGFGRAQETLLRVAEHPEIGPHLVDVDGLAVYAFDDDTATTSACADACTRAWKPLLAPGPSADGFPPLPLGTGLDPARVATLVRPDGSRQLAYAGRPLYRFFADKAPGDLKGQGRQDKWFAVSPDGERARAAPPEPATVTATVPVGWAPAADLTVAAGSLWVPVGGDAQVVRIDPASGRRLATIAVGGAHSPKTEANARTLVGDGAALWVVHDTYDSDDAELLRISPDVNAVTATIPVTLPRLDGFMEARMRLAAGGGALWLVSEAHGLLLRVDPERGAVTARRELPTPSAVAFGHGSVWVAGFDGNGTTVHRLDPDSLEIRVSIPVAAGVQALRLLASDDLVWLTADVPSRSGSSAAMLVGIDPRSDEVAVRVGVPAQPAGLWVDAEGIVWITAQGLDDRSQDARDGRLLRIDPQRPDALKVWHLGRDPVGLVGVQGALWSADSLGLDGVTYRIEPAP